MHRARDQLHIVAAGSVVAIIAKECSYGMMPLVHQISGTVLVLVGLIVLPLPLPFGLIMLTIGFALLAPYIPAVQRLLRHLRSRWPDLDAALRRYRHKFPPIIKKTIDKTNPAAPAE